MYYLVRIIFSFTRKYFYFWKFSHKKHDHLSDTPSRLVRIYFVLFLFVYSTLLAKLCYLMYVWHYDRVIHQASQISYWRSKQFHRTTTTTTLSHTLNLLSYGYFVTIPHLPHPSVPWVLLEGRWLPYLKVVLYHLATSHHACKRPGEWRPWYCMYMCMYISTY